MSTIPVGGTTGHDHESSAAIDEAAAWLSTVPQDQRPRPVIPELRRRFGLTAEQACIACREASLRNGRAH